MGAQRIRERFALLREQGRLGLIPFLTVGFPDLEATLDLVPALEEAGVDLIELGVPFSDPLADGPTIQRTSFHALQQGVTLPLCLEACARLRDRGVSIPLVLMGYYNPYLKYGLERTVRGAQEAGVDGFIVADLPAEEAGPFREVCTAYGLALIPLLAPTSSEERVRLSCPGAEGFIYCVSLTGVTGARETLPPGVEDLIARVRRHTPLPVAVGFGISRREHLEALAPYADAAVVGSALLDALSSAPREHLARRAREFLLSLTGPARPAHRR